MAEMGSFAELANVSVGEVERPKPIPEGHYTAQFTGPMKEKRAKSGNLAMSFPFRLVAPGDNVSVEELNAAGGLPDKEFTLDFWMSPDARYRFTDFAKAMGASEDLNLLQCAEWLIENNQPFTIQAKRRQSDKDESVFYTDFDNPAAAA